MKENEYQCASCGGVFDSKPKEGWTEKDKWAEHDRNFPGASHEDTEVVCDDCYLKMIAADPPPGMVYVSPLKLKINSFRFWLWQLLHPKQVKAIETWTEEYIKKLIYGGTTDKQ